MPLTLSPTQVAFNARGDGSFNRPFAAQVEFLRPKLNLPTRHWDDILKSAHDRAFIVAGAMKADLLKDFHDAILKSAAEGKSIQWFRKEFDAIVARHGWSGFTGDGTKAGRDWRARVIYQTNLSTSYAAGRWAQLNDPDLLEDRPYWKYIHSDTVQHPRKLHLEWGRKPVVLRHDDPWWQTHFPPNGWGCFPGETLVRASAQLGQRFRYAGKMVELGTFGGQRLTVTPNHPVLTRQGWVPAGELQAGDQVLTAAIDSDAALPGIVDDPQPPARAEYLFQALAAEGLRVIPMSPDDFHGDALGGEGEVHIAGSDSVLMDVMQSEARESIGKGGLQQALCGRVETPGIADSAPFSGAIGADPTPAEHAANRRLGQAQPLTDPRLADEAAAVDRHSLAFGGHVAVVSGLPCSAHESFPPIRRTPLGLPALHHAGGTVAALDAMQPQYASQRATTEAQLFGQLLEANAGLIAADEIIFIRQLDWFGHVYDFTTTTGMIMAGGVVVSNCRCRVTAVGKDEYPGDPAPNDKTWVKEDRHGDRHEIPNGIDYGWDYAPGANVAQSFQSLIDDKLIRLPAPIGAAMWQALKPVLAMERQLQWWQTLDEWLADPLPRGKMAVVGALKPETVQWLAEHDRPKPLSAEIAIRDNLPKGVKQARHEAAQNALTLEEWRSLPALLDRPGAIYLDKASGKLIFVAEALGPAKVAVEFDPGKLKNTEANLIKGAFRVDDAAIAGAVKGGEWIPVEVSGRRVGVEPT